MWAGLLNPGVVGGVSRGMADSPKDSMQFEAPAEHRGPAPQEEEEEAAVAPEASVDSDLLEDEGLFYASDLMKELAQNRREQVGMERGYDRDAWLSSGGPMSDRVVRWCWNLDSHSSHQGGHTWC
jgi:hypothetical protein